MPTERAGGPFQSTCIPRHLRWLVETRSLNFLAAIWAAAFLFGANGCDGTVSASPQELQLVEEAATRLPDSLVITQGSLSDQGKAVVWGPNGAWVIRNGGAEDLCNSPVRGVLAGRIKASGEVEVLLGPPSQALVTSTSRGCRITEIGPELVALRAATFMKGRWLGVGGGGQLVEITPDAKTHPLTYSSSLMMDLARTSSDTLPLWMAPAGDGFILGTRAPPFVWVYTDLDVGEVVANPLQFEKVRSGREMISTGVVSAKAGFLQIVADLTSDARMLLLFDPEGRPLRVSELAIPFEVLASNEQTRRILALRRTDFLEAVIYKFTWNGGRGRD